MFFQVSIYKINMNSKIYVFIVNEEYGRSISLKHWSHAANNALRYCGRAFFPNNNPLISVIFALVTSMEKIFFIYVLTKKIAYNNNNSSDLIHVISYMLHNHEFCIYSLLNITA